MTLPWTQGILCGPSGAGTSSLIGGFLPTTKGTPWANGIQATSVDLTTGEYLANSSNNTLGFTNAWTINFWGLRETGSDVVLYEIGGNAASSRIRCVGTGTTINVFLYNSGGTLFKEWRWNDLIPFSTAAWSMVTVTWDGTDIKAYLNGVDLGTADTKATDNSDSMTNAARDVFIGADSAGANVFLGSIHHVAIWDVALDADAVAEIFFSGNGAAANYDKNYGDYTSAGDVVHWWRFGHDPSNIGRDFVTSGGVDVDTNAAGVTTADLEAYRPEGAAWAMTSNECLRYGVAAGGGGSTTTTLGVANSFSLYAFFRIDSTGAQTIFDANAGDSNVGRDSDSRIELRVNSTKLEFRVFDSSGTGVTVAQSVNVRTGEWYHVVCVKDGTSRASLYVNGVEDAFTTTSVPTTTDAARIVGIGSIPIGNTANMDGRVREVALWNTALSQTQIEAFYNAGIPLVNLKRSHGLYIPNSSLKHWWRARPTSSSYGTGGNIVMDDVITGGINLETNAANMSVTADVLQSQSSPFPWGASVYFDGTSDYFDAGSASDIGLTNDWTILVWCKPQGGASTTHDNIFAAYNGTTNGNKIDIRFLGNVAGDPFGVQVYDSGATLLKDYRFTPGTTQMACFVVSWNGTSLRGWVDGVEDTSPTKTTDNSVTQTNTNRRIYIGNDPVTGSRTFEGHIHVVAIWNEVLSDDEIRELSYHGTEFDYGAAGTVYSSAANLQHLYRLGADPNDLGNDYAGSIDLTPTSLDDTDIQIDGPFEDIA